MKSRRRIILAVGGVSIVLCLACLVLTTIIRPPSEPVAQVETSVADEATAIADVIATQEPRPTDILPAGTPTTARTVVPLSATPSATETRTPRPTAPPSPTASPAVSTVAPSSTPTTASPDVPEGQLASVVRIIDGDTIEVNIDGANYRLRYIGMDTPEVGDPFFLEANEANRQLVEGTTVILVKDVSEVDRYGRLLRYVYLQDGTFVNAELVRLGYAKAATFPPDVTHAELFVSLEREARDAGIGLWAAPPVVIAATNTPRPQPTATQPPPPTAPPQSQATTPPQPQPTAPPPEPTSPPASPGDVIISYIFFDGQLGNNEPDEYAVITNRGGTLVNMGGWRLNADDRGQDFGFPAFDLQPGQSCRVYTNQVQADSCGGASFFSGKALWANSGECGHLFNASGVEVSTYCY